MTNNRAQLLQSHINRLDAVEYQIRNLAPNVAQKVNWASWQAENLAVIEGLREEIMLAELTGADLPNREYVDVARFYIQSRPPSVPPTPSAIVND